MGGSSLSPPRGTAAAGRALMRTICTVVAGSIGIGRLDALLPGIVAVGASHPPSSTSEVVEEICRAGEVDEESDGSELISFVRGKGGTVDPRLEIRRERPGDPASIRGVFATDAIREGEALFTVPWDAILHAADDVEGFEIRLCDVIRVVARELALGEQSDFAPYVRYLLAQRPGIIPDTWSDEGNTMLSMIRGLHLPPQEQEYSYVWAEHCNLDEPLELFAAELVVTRHTDELMVPLYDELNHGNGRAHNVKLEINEGTSYDVIAKRDIEKGEQILESYNMQEASPYLGFYGTPEILREYGFVEPLPQRWGLQDDIEFDLLRGEKGKLEVKWNLETTVPNHDTVAFLRGELARLGTVRKMAKSLAGTMPKREWDTNCQYLEALVTALSKAIDAAEVSRAG